LQRSCTICYVKRFSKLSYMYFFIFFAFFTPGKQPYFEISDGHPQTQSTSLVSAHDHWWTLDFANAFVSPGVNSRGELVPSHGASRRRLGDYSNSISIPRGLKSFMLKNCKVDFLEIPRLRFFYTPGIWQLYQFLDYLMSINLHLWSMVEEGMRYHFFQYNC
jgi:hypothetical protein